MSENIYRIETASPTPTLGTQAWKIEQFQRQVRISLSLSSRFEFTGVCRFDLYGLLRILYICLICLQLFMLRNKCLLVLLNKTAYSDMYIKHD